MDRLKDKVAIITGGTGGIGKETAKRFLEEGASVALVDLNAEVIAQTVAELAPLGSITGIAADVSQESDVANYVQTTIKHFGRIDILFNNAGIEGRVKPIIEQNVEDFDQVLSVNARGVFLGLKHVLPVMYQQKSGSVINTSSAAGLTGTDNIAPYVASKHAVVGLTKSAALESGPHNVRVNAIHPSPVNTRMIRSLEEGFSPGHPDAMKQMMESAIPMGRYAEPIDIANCVLFLASDESSFISGSSYRVDGALLSR